MVTDGSESLLLLVGKRTLLRVTSDSPVQNDWAYCWPPDTPTGLDVVSSRVLNLRISVDCAPAGLMSATTRMSTAAPTHSRMVPTLTRAKTPLMFI